MKNNTSLAQIYFGLVILTAGAGLLLDALHIIDFGAVFGGWWPLAIIGAGVIAIFTNPRAFLWPLGIIIAGALLLAQQLQLVNINVGSLIWPVAVIALGLSVIFEQKNWGWAKPRDLNEGALNISVIMSGQNTRVTHKEFTGGQISAIMGGVDLDLRDASIKKEAALRIFTLCGGVDIKVPQGWVVRMTGTPIMGGWEDKTRGPLDAKNAPVLYIDGTCIMGGISIKD